MGLISKKNKTSAGKLFGVNAIYGAEDGKQTPYMYRAWFGRLRFHLFCRGDQDPDCHDHPWGFWTFPLRSYVEEILHERIETYYPINAEPEVTIHYERETRVVKAFRWHYRRADFRHRVLGLSRGLSNHRAIMFDPTGLIPTIVWRDAPSRAWGFTKERDGSWCWVPWREYVYEGGKDAPCE